jgi:hypothetical protein
VTFMPPHERARAPVRAQGRIRDSATLPRVALARTRPLKPTPAYRKPGPLYSPA